MADSRHIDAASHAPAPLAGALADAATRMAAAATAAASGRCVSDAAESTLAVATAAAPPIVPATLAAAAGLAASAARAAAAAPAASEPSSDPASAALAAAAAVGRAAGISTSTAVGTAVAASAARRRRTRPCAGRAETVGELEKSLHRTVDTWMERGKPRTTAAAYMPPVPLHVLQSASTTRETLQQLCTERTIPFGEDDSAQSLKASLGRFNATGTTVWGARMQALAVFVRTKGKHNFFAAMEHGSDVGVDGAASEAAAPPCTSARPPVPMRRSSHSPSPATPRSEARAGGEDPGPPHFPASPSSRLPSPAHPQDPTGRPIDSSPIVNRPSPLILPDAPTPAGLLPSSQHAAMMLQSIALEQDERVRGLAKSAQVAEVKEMVWKMNKCMQANAKSAAASATRLDGAMAGLVCSSSTLTAAAAAISAGYPRVRAGAEPSSKRARLHAGLALPPVGRGGPGSGAGVVNTVGALGGAVAGGSNPMAPPSAAPMGNLHDLVFSMTIPPEMLSGKMESESLFVMLIKMIKCCHVTAGYAGIFGSIAVNQLYRDGVERATREMKRGRAVAGTINNSKTERMGNIVKNKVRLYLKQLYWLNLVVPGVIKPPSSASFEDVQKAELGTTACRKLTEALRSIADEYALPANHPLREPITAKSFHLRNQINAMSGRPGTPSATADILSASPFRELLAKAEENMRAKYL